QVSGIPVEVVRATVFYKQRWMLLLMDTSAACAKNPSVFDGTYLSWVTPRLITPLVLHPTKFLDKRITMGVEGRVLDEVTATSRGYQLLVNSTAVEIRIPFGAVGGYRKSHVIENKYNQVYEIDLFLEHQWADDLWEVTQHRSFKPARSPYLPETPYVVNSEYSPQPCTVGMCPIPSSTLRSLCPSLCWSLCFCRLSSCSPTARLTTSSCWATLTPELDSSPQWDLVTDRCLVTGDSYRTHFHPVPASTLTRSSPQLQRLEVRAQQSNKDSAFWRKVYFHCMAVVCDPNLEDTCNKTCVPGAQRSGEHLEISPGIQASMTSCSTASTVLY
ncbi:UNVERIFIED_CONTAM: hypothetical protein FKN15_034776, partial [Acipenser sinensis]